MANIYDSKDIIATTLNAWLPEIQDGITNNNGLLYFFKNFGKLGLKGKNNEPMGSIETLDGGARIQVHLSLVENPNAGFYGYDEAAGTVIQDSMDTAYFNWKFLKCNIPINKKQILLNEGSRYQMHNLVDSVKKVALQTIVNKTGIGLWNTTDSDSFVGIPLMITDDGTTTGSSAIGGLSTASYSNWKNQFETLATHHTSAELKNAMNTVYRKCTVGADAPDLILCGSTLYGEIEAGMQVNERYDRAGKDIQMAKSGFISLGYKNAIILYDENCPANRIYFVNSRHMAFYIHEKDAFTMGEKQVEFGGDKVNYPLSATCALVCKNRRMHGVLVITDETTTTTTTTTTSE